MTESLITLLQENGYIILFLGTIIGGEVIVLAAAFLASLGYLNIGFVLLIGTFGIVVADNIWYLIGREQGKVFIRHFGKYFYIKPEHIRKIKIHFRKRPKRFIFFSKFLYGTRTVTLISAGLTRLNYRTFFLMNLYSVIVWILIIGFIGYTSGISWSIIKEKIDFAKQLVFAIIAIVIGFKYYLIRRNRLDDE